MATLPSLAGYAGRLKLSILPGVDRFLRDCRSYPDVDQQTLSCAEDAIADLRAAVSDLVDNLEAIVSGRPARTPMVDPHALSQMDDDARALCDADGLDYSTISVTQRLAYRLAAAGVSQSYQKHLGGS